MAKDKWDEREDQRDRIAADLGNAWGELLIADAEHKPTQETLADVLRFYGWKCKAPWARKAVR